MNRVERSSINMVTSAASYVAPMVVNFVATPLLLRALGQAAYGIQNLVAVLVGYLTIMDLGLDIPIVKYLAEDHARKDAESANRLVNTTLQIYGVIGVAGMLLIGAAASFLARRVFTIPPELIGQATWVFVFAGAGFLGSVLSAWGRAVANGVQRYDVSSAASTLNSIVGVVAGLGAVYAGLGVAGYVFVRSLVSILTGVLYLAMVPRLLPQVRLRSMIDWAVVRRIRGYLGSGVTLRILSAVTTNMDYTLISIWLGVAILPAYSVPFVVYSSVLYLISTTLHYAFPMASELYSTGQQDALRDIYTRIVRFATAFAAMTFVPFVILGDAFLTLWVGPAMAGQSTLTLRLLLLAGYLTTLTGTITVPLMAGTGYIRDFTLYNIIRSSAIVLSCALLIRPMGIAGAATAWLIAGLFDVALQVFAVRRYLHMSLAALFRAAYLKPILLGLVMAGLAGLCRPLANSWLGLAAVVIGLEFFYVLAGFWIGVFGETEKRAMLGLWQMAALMVRRFQRQHETL